MPEQSQKNRLISLRPLGSLFNFLLFSNIFLSVSVTSLVFETTLILNHPIREFSYPLFLFSATLFLYCFHRIYRSNYRSPSEKLTSRHAWVINHRGLFYFILVLAGAVTFFSVIFFIPMRVILFLTPVAFISLGYTIPCIPSHGKLIRLRDIPGIKIFLIAFVLGLTTVLLPILAHSRADALMDPAILFIFFRRMLFIFAITIPFDIRDLDYDRESKTQTLPVMLGVRNSRNLAFLALFMFSVLTGLQYMLLGKTRASYCIALLISAGIAAIILHYSNRKQNDFFYSFYLEGTMLLQCILVIGAGKFWT